MTRSFLPHSGWGFFIPMYRGPVPMGPLASSSQDFHPYMAPSPTLCLVLIMGLLVPCRWGLAPIPAMPWGSHPPASSNFVTLASFQGQGTAAPHSCPVCSAPLSLFDQVRTMALSAIGPLWQGVRELLTPMVFLATYQNGPGPCIVLDVGHLPRTVLYPATIPEPAP